MKTAELEYDLPPELIAQHPASRRDESRLLVYDRRSGEVRHRVFADRLDERTAAGHRALAAMERHLESRDFFVGDDLSLADIALYAYTHVAHEGGFELAGYPAVRAWLDRVAAVPGHVPMEA